MQVIVTVTALTAEYPYQELDPAFTYKGTRELRAHTGLLCKERHHSRVVDASRIQPDGRSTVYQVVTRKTTQPLGRFSEPNFPKSKGSTHNQNTT